MLIDCGLGERRLWGPQQVVHSTRTGFGFSFVLHRPFRPSSSVDLKQNKTKQDVDGREEEKKRANRTSRATYGGQHMTHRHKLTR
jgi:hypothetical protein